MCFDPWWKLRKACACEFAIFSPEFSISHPIPTKASLIKMEYSGKTFFSPNLMEWEKKWKFIHVSSSMSKFPLFQFSLSFRGGGSLNNYPLLLSLLPPSPPPPKATRSFTYYTNQISWISWLDFPPKRKSVKCFRKKTLIFSSSFSFLVWWGNGSSGSKNAPANGNKF